MEGETVPLEMTAPVTILMPEPERTLSILRWLRAGHEERLENREIDSPLVKDILEKLPSLNELLDWPNDPDPFWKRDRLHEAMTEDCWRGFGKKIYSEKELARMNRCVLMMHKNTYGGGTLHSDLVQDYAFGFILEGEQKDILPRFTRAQQKKIGSWQVRIPVAAKNIFQRLSVCLYPESAHAEMRRQQPVLSSIGCAYGFGARLFIAPPSKRLTDEMRPFLERFNELDEWGKVLDFDKRTEVPLALEAHKLFG